MLKINPKLIRKHKINNIIKASKKAKMEPYCYGRAFVLDVKKSGIFFDMVVPMTFGLITLGLIKVFGNKELMRFTWGE